MWRGAFCLSGLACYNSQMIIIVSDGSSRGNPGPGGYGTIVVHGDNVTEFAGYEKKTTNNRMEIMGVIAGLDFVLSRNLGDTVRLYSDSAYVLGGIESWLKNWKKNGWQTANKKPVLNQDLWETLDGQIERLKKMECVKVKGHAGVMLNERADYLATAYADGLDIHLYHGDKEVYKKMLKPQ